ncbi:MMPL family transporter [Streptomyces poriferorum]|uniref:MMPL family transporter n=2 Tax=Streptomyces poriferorum TaxID=2798799 RepID=A0ABY9J1I5_9ACTN|nr:MULTISPECIES: MMPL family transporter [unclassified Streptomyces]MDP5316309.1 MMPL family transporter [Streptomyces sp. Alt4]WLQ61553.1 MMPL family transporter [Streptomyces sp. Alt2]
MSVPPGFPRPDARRPGARRKLAGIVAALVTLVLLFGSLLAASLPLITALFAVGGAIGLIALASHIHRTPGAELTSPRLASLQAAPRPRRSPVTLVHWPTGRLADWPTGRLPVSSRLRSCRRPRGCGRCPRGRCGGRCVRRSSRVGPE